MNGVIELEEVMQPQFIIDESIDDSQIMFLKKLKEANEMLEKYPPPADWLLSRYSKTQQEEGIYVSGTLKCVNIEANTFLVVEMHGLYEVHFNILTTVETMNQLHINMAINVRIRPQINKDNQFEYELMEVE